MRGSDIARWASLLVPTLAALAASAAMLVDYTRPSPVFCEPGGGCDAVKKTALAHPLGVPMPAIGVAAFVALGTLIMLRGVRARLVHLVVASVATVVAAGLVVVQARMGSVCPYCMVTDVSAMVLLVAVFWRYRSGWDLPDTRLLSFATSGALVAAFAVPLGLSLALGPRPPPVVAEELARTPPGMVTIVDFADFECPWCRLNHTSLRPLLEANKGKIRVARKQVPLSMHVHAMTAARTAVCAEKLGKGEVVAEALFSVDPTNLDLAGCETIARAAGLDLTAFRACFNEPTTLERIEKDRADFRASGSKGLPTLWIGTERLEGAQELPALQAALSRALAHAR